MQHAPPLRVLLVEDDPDVAAGICAYLEMRGVRVDFAYTSAQAHARLADAAFDLLILDAQLPDEDGIRLCRTLKRAGVAAPVLFLTARGALEDKLEAFDAGAIDYMVKPFAPAELFARIRALTAHVPAAGGPRLRAGGYTLDLHGRLLEYGDKRLALHATGFSLLRCLMSASPGSVDRRTLCDLLWGNALPDSDPLRMHVYELRRAIAEHFGTAPIETVRGVGYRFVTDCDDPS
ncbi:hypothetical protein GCM10007167_10690 [Vulcaniibacterium thermophilum]|uniref:DNA-binding response regulator, OmpR family, contains REC and winged-helix (WHTH) domain n=1 Tax=Vulcaniibacterium thermophilum TaxID=1169913 RepID=A0A918Z055_9GAMM|nr:hypothetical protein GCM10007167_10690 [Vulcaniibacterium thermophilum]